LVHFLEITAKIVNYQANSLISLKKIEKVSGIDKKWPLAWFSMEKRPILKCWCCFIRNDVPRVVKSSQNAQAACSFHLWKSISSHQNKTLLNRLYPVILTDLEKIIIFCVYSTGERKLPFKTGNPWSLGAVLSRQTGV